MEHQKLKDWLKENEGKSYRDWLIQKCDNEQKRADLNRLLNLCEHFDIAYQPLQIDFVEEVKEYVGENPKFYENHDVNRVRGLVRDRAFDLYFPSKGWVINVGEELLDTYYYFTRLIVPEGETSSEWLGFELLMQEAIKEDDQEHQPNFEKHLTEKFHFPGYGDPNTHGYPGTWRFYPWTYCLEGKKIDGNDYFHPGSVGEFYRNLFGDKFEEAREYSIEAFLADNPHLRDRRADLLHQRCQWYMTEKKVKSLPTSIIKSLLNQADKELAVIYPDFRMAALM